VTFLNESSICLVKTGLMDFFSLCSQPLKEYEYGFGDPLGEFWLGLKTIQKIVDRRPHELLIRLTEVGENGKNIFAR